MLKDAILRSMFKKFIYVFELLLFLKAFSKDDYKVLSLLQTYKNLPTRNSFCCTAGQLFVHSKTGVAATRSKKSKSVQYTIHKP
jgi:hypothetical protein